jgi:hypothetical protein
MVERNLFLSIKLYGGTFFMQPLALGLIILTILVLCYNIYKMTQTNKG